MAETFSPNAQAKRLPITARIQSPTSAFLVDSNDDQLERAQARAARAAAIRRNAVAASLHSQPPPPPPLLTKHQILDLFHNCVKLATENKINQKNTWDLNLIDHLTDIIRADEGTHVETNFQICSDATLAIVNAEGGQESRKGIDKKLSPFSTLELPFEVLNVKKFDVAFAVDPLYRQTSAQFDVGGAKGLLMNNLGLYGRCRVLFDSLEVPSKCMSSENEQNISDTIDLSFARDCIEQMIFNINMKDEISPTLSVIVKQFDENNKRPSDFEFSGQTSVEEYDAPTDCENATEREEYAWSDDHANPTIVADLSSNDAGFPSYHKETGPFPSQDPDMDGMLENVDGYLFFSLGFRSKKNAWAGPDHWKYRKAEGSESENNSTSEGGSIKKTRQPRTKGQIEEDLDFTNFLHKKIPDIFSPAKNPKSLVLHENIPSCITKLPEDCHYEPEDLAKLFLLPNTRCLWRRVTKFLDGSREQCNDWESFPSWDKGSVCDGDVHSDTDDSSTLVSQPRRININEVQYDKTSKQVDVQALKFTLWDHIQESFQLPSQGKKEIVSFRHILANLPNECNAAATAGDISPHLCFICLLHLANEKGLSIQSCPNLDDLAICLPEVGATKTGKV